MNKTIKNIYRIFLSLMAINGITVGLDPIKVKDIIINSSSFDHNSFLKDIKELKNKDKLKITLASNIDENHQSMESLKKILEIIKKMNIVVEIDASRLNLQDHRTIIEETIDHIYLFNVVKFGSLEEEENDEYDREENTIQKKLDQVLQNHYQNISISTDNDIMNKKSNYSISCSGKSKNLKVFFYKNLKMDPSKMNRFSPFQVMMNDFPSEVMGPKKSTNKDINDLEKRIKKFKNSSEVNHIVKKRVEDLWEIVKKSDGNPNNSSEYDKARTALDNILYSIILKDEHAKNTKIITNKLKAALEKNDTKLYKKLQSDILENLFIKNQDNITIEDKDKLYKSSNAEKIVNTLLSDIRSLSDPNRVKNYRIGRLLYGAPGTGKTKSIQMFAKACNIPCVVLNADQEKSYFDGIGYSYVGARPGAFIRALKEYAGGKERLDKNEASQIMIIVLDEVDKYCSEAAESLLKFIDSSQQGEDKNLNIPVPLDNVIIYCTANDLNKISQPLRDRLNLIPMVSMDDGEKLAIINHTLKIPLLQRFGARKINVQQESLRSIFHGIPQADGARQAVEYTNRIASEIIEYYINEDETKPIEVTAALVNKFMSKLQKKFPELFPYISKIGYINGVVVWANRDNYNRERPTFKVTNLTASATEHYTGDHIIIPTDNTTNALLKSLSRNMDTLLQSSFKSSNKNISINVKITDLSSENNRQMLSLAAIAWASAVLKQKIKAFSTIIAELLPDNSLEYDKDTIIKIKMVYNAGLKNIVIAKIDNTKNMDDGNPNNENINEYTNELQNLINEFNLKVKISNDKYTTYIAADPKRSYGDIEIHMAKDLKTAVDLLLIKTL